MPSAIDRFLTAIGYPERAPDGATSFELLVDGGTVRLWTESGSVFLSRALACATEDLPRLAAMAPGRMLREEAALSADPSSSDGAFLWQSVPETADARAMQRLFESFCDSCDWWLERVREFGEPVAEIPPLTIRP